MHHPPSHTGAVVLPRYIEDERDYGGRSVHTVVLFPSPGGWGQATALRLHLEDSAAGMFDIATFGSVYVRAVSAAYMVRCLATPWLLSGLRPASVTCNSGRLLS